MQAMRNGKTSITLPSFTESEGACATPPRCPPCAAPPSAEVPRCNALRDRRPIHRQNACNIIISSFHPTPTPRATVPDATNLQSLVIRSGRQALVELAILDPGLCTSLPGHW
ncbi:hypothetical protein M3J09_004495 [Ascochyta lentis]